MAPPTCTDASTPSTPQLAAKYYDLFDQVAPRFATLAEQSLSEVTELLEDTQNMLDDLWRLDVGQSEQYPQERMRHLLGVLGGAVGRHVQATLASLALWTDTYSKVTNKTRQLIWRGNPPNIGN